MSKLDNLITEIIQQTERETKEILEAAKAENVSFTENEHRKTEKLCGEIRQKAQTEAVAEKEKIVSNAKLRARDMVLFAKQELVADVLARVLEKLKNLEVSEYTQFVKNILKSFENTKELEVLLTKEMKENIGNEISGYKVSSEVVDSGCSIKVGELFYNNEFTTLLDLDREQLEKEILEKIFA